MYSQQPIHLLPGERLSARIDIDQNRVGLELRFKEDDCEHNFEDLVAIVARHESLSRDNLLHIGGLAAEFRYREGMDTVTLAEQGDDIVVMLEHYADVPVATQEDMKRALRQLNVLYGTVLDALDVRGIERFEDKFKRYIAAPPVGGMHPKTKSRWEVPLFFHLCGYELLQLYRGSCAFLSYVQRRLFPPNKKQHDQRIPVVKDHIIFLQQELVVLEQEEAIYREFEFYEHVRMRLLRRRIHDAEQYLVTALGLPPKIP